MEKIVIRGGKPLNGSVVISGMKNAALGIIFGCLLVKDKITLEDLPMISDVKLSLEILRRMGAEVAENADGSVVIDCTNAVGGISPCDLVKKMRASYYLLGAELGRFGRAKVGRSGGCDFGTRPIDQHIKGFEALGGVVTLSDDYIRIEAENGIRGSELFFDVITVGGTINMLLAAVLAEGTTVIENAAKEPHIVDVANFLNTCGAVITGAGTDTIKIKGVKELHGCTYAIVPDMIEAGTYMIAAAATRGCLRIENVIPKHLESITAKLVEMGVSVDEFDDAIVVSAPDPLRHINLKTLPYPGYPTDMQPQICALLSISEGTSHLIEGVIENRFRYVEELRRLGASIEVNGKTATINGVSGLHGARVRAVDLRAGAAMVIAGLASDGVTEIEDIHHIERGYNDIVGKLKKVGADIEKVEIQTL
ncbi:MAG: UDP-N-acetylglucosamine 1-carboxyvinyltransferase [Lachnospiraceae bacterium]|nr:UDP-N-acetylglucosamine 1-carboxyvinyltransferase [Lachnospiraceae bacterium]